jgi:hypothetical protein
MEIMGIILFCAVMTLLALELIVSAVNLYIMLPVLESHQE